MQLGHSLSALTSGSPRQTTEMPMPIQMLEMTIIRWMRRTTTVRCRIWGSKAVVGCKLDGRRFAPDSRHDTRSIDLLLRAEADSSGGFSHGSCRQAIRR